MDESYFQPEELIKAWRKRATGIVQYSKMGNLHPAAKAKYEEAAYTFRFCASDLAQALRNKNVRKQ